MSKDTQEAPSTSLRSLLLLQHSTLRCHAMTQLPRSLGLQAISEMLTTAEQEFTLCSSATSILHIQGEDDEDRG